MGEALTPLFDSRKVAVFGGGNVAMDAARTAKRLGAEQVTIVYRRTEVEMPARKEEVAHAKEEGVEFLYLHAPLKITADEKGRVNGVELITCVLGEADASGRRSPVEVPGSEKLYDYDTVIVAIGNDSNPLIKATTDGIEVNRRGTSLSTKRPVKPPSRVSGQVVISCSARQRSFWRWARDARLQRR